MVDVNLTRLRAEPRTPSMAAFLDLLKEVPCEAERTKLSDEPALVITTEHVMYSTAIGRIAGAAGLTVCYAAPAPCLVLHIYQFDSVNANSFLYGPQEHETPTLPAMSKKAADLFRFGCYMAERGARRTA